MKKMAETSANAAPPSKAPMASPGRANIIAIASGKGGVGKTWLSTTIASAFAFRDQRVLLFDGDLGLANVDVQLGLTPEHDLGSVIAGRLSLTDAITAFEGGATGANRSAGGFDVLAGRSGSGALSSLTQAEIQGMIQGLYSLADQYDRVIIDLAAGVDRAVTTLAAAAASVLVVLTDEPTSLTDAYAFVKIMSSRKPELDVRIVVNQAESLAQGRKVYQALLTACRNFLDVAPPLAGVISRDPKVRDSIRQQTSILSRHPKSLAGADVAKLAGSLAQNVGN